MFVWVMLIDSWLIVIALPPLSAAQIMLLIDRFLGGTFFNTQAGGSAVLWQHFFWIFGHPEVYILIFPSFAILSEVIPVFSRKPIFGKPAMVGAVIAIGFISLGVWAHHMFAVGMTSWSNTFFTASTMLVGVPTGIKIFNWTATMYGGKLRLETPMLFCIAFLLQFLVAGLTGIMLAAAPFDWQLHDSYFVVGHFHFTLVAGLVFGLFAGIYYWFPKATGRMMDEKLGKLHFWLFVIGVNLTFIPDALSRLPRNAAPNLHLRAESRLGDLEPGHINRCNHSGHRGGHLCLQRAPLGFEGPHRRRRPLGWMDPRMGYVFAPA